MTRATVVVVATLVLAGQSVVSVAQTTIETDGEVKAQGFDGDGSQLTNVDAATLGGEASGFFATAAELLAAMEALNRPDGPCFDTTHRFVNCENGTVTDTVTGLIWLHNANCFGLQDWVEANQSAAALADGSCGLTDGSRAGDWRLPTREEWEGILDSGCTDPPKIVGNQSSTAGCYIDALDPSSEWATSVQSAFYLSSTTNRTFPGLVWGASMNLGFVDAIDKTFNKPVWPVRGGH